MANAPTGARAGGSGRRRRLLPLAGSVAALLVVGIGLGFTLGRHQPPRQSTASALRPSGLPSAVSTSLADLMGLSPVPTKTAPGFVLTDQDGQTLPLSAFRGKVVVLEAMDPHCVDICPLVSQEFIDAYHDLGRSASHVVFAALNVNQHYPSVQSMLTFSEEHNLTSIPTWHFFTGPIPKLKAAWTAYNIQVQAPNPNADILHTSIVYFIDPHGVERYVAAPMVDHGANGKTYLPGSTLTSWGQGIALVAKHLGG